MVNQDNGFSFVNARSYESVAFVYDNNGTLNVNGVDLNYIQVTSANFTQILRYDGMMVGHDRTRHSRLRSSGRNALSRFPASPDQHRPVRQHAAYRESVELCLEAQQRFCLVGRAYGIIGQVNQSGSLPMAA